MAKSGRWWPRVNTEHFAMNTQTQTQTHSGSHAQPPVQPSAAPRSRQHRRIMLVSTRCSTLLALQRACRADQAVQFCFYANSAAASRALRRFQPDALLLDVACTGRAAVELVQRVRALETAPTVAVLADSVGPRMCEAVEHVGAHGGLPVTAPDLLERLGGLASRTPARRADAA
jgi:CheY-like chemotaxis protein